MTQIAVIKEDNKNKAQMRAKSLKSPQPRRVFYAVGGTFSDQSHSPFLLETFLAENLSSL